MSDLKSWIKRAFFPTYWSVARLNGTLSDRLDKIVARLDKQVQRLDRQGQRVHRLEAQSGRLHKFLGDMNITNRLGQLKEQLDVLSKQLDQLEIAPGLERLDKRFAQIDDRIEQLEVGQRLSKLDIDRALAELKEKLELHDRRFNQIQGNFPKTTVRGPSDSLSLTGVAEIVAAEDSARYMIQHMTNAERFSNTAELLEAAVGWACNPKLILEFGVYSGTTINVIAKAAGPDCRIYGYDSFEGLPETWRPGYVKGKFARSDLPEVPDNVTLVAGWFEDTLPGYLKQETAAPDMIHVDCDLYSSTKFVLDSFRDCLGPSTIVVFDEYFNYPGWEEHEFKAFQEFIAKGGFTYEYLGLVPHHQQVAVRLNRQKKSVCSRAATAADRNAKS